MDINVTYLDGKWVTDPNPAIVSAGTRVRWVFRSTRLPVNTLAWRVRFGESGPFGSKIGQLQAKSINLHSRNKRIIEALLQEIGIEPEFLFDHIATTEDFAAEEPGEYKYDLEVADAATEKVLGDEDPYLYVVTSHIADGEIKPFRK